jgi:hypothetical protein
VGGGEGGGVGLEGLQGLKLVIITKNGFCSDHATYTGFRFVADWSYGGVAVRWFDSLQSKSDAVRSCTYPH